MAKGWPILVLLILAGCNSKLETGYEPVKLGSMTPAERRGLYAPDYSIEAQAAQADQNGNKAESQARPLGGNGE
jgi:hypothetical protein